ncbi:MAG TPA: RNA polymerase factor sigma-54 [Pseudoneobacillus sp.]|nr:RNA polymerase factor sigma-54 [Pseudoneobacillus sp.]
MDFKQGLFQQQTLKLTMTQELSQAIALLQYSTQELTAFLESKALENPLIQIDSNVVPVNPLQDRKKRRKAAITNVQNDWLEQIGEHKQSLSDHLIAQIPINEEIKPVRQLIESIILCLDENGYLSIYDAELQKQFSLTDEQLAQSLSIIQAMEPAGIGARSLQECLLLQLKRKTTPESLVITLVKEHFQDFAEKKWKELANKLHVSMAEIQFAFDELQSLDPRPGSKFISEQTAFITPDVVVMWDGKDYSITIFDELLPKVSFNDDFYHHYANTKDQQVTKYMEHQFQNYQWLQKSLEQRKETLQRVALKIVEKQPEFFKNGPSNLKPMVMKSVADELEIHESTVSRAVREKYVQTPFGIFELKSFFTSTIQTTSDESTSSTQVKNALTKLIEAENKLKPLSDQDIVQILKDDEGIVVSRRTVAKYRDQLGIQSSSKRRRYE